MAQSTDRHSGFTLLEMMLVIVLIGIVGTLTVGRLSPDRDPFSYPVATLRVTLQNALELATQQEALYGLALAHNGWQLMVYRHEKTAWQPVQHVPFHLPENMSPSLQIEQQPIPLPEEVTPQAEPQIWIYAGGETTAFSLSLLQGACQQRLTANGFMSFQLGEVHCDDE